MYDCIIVGGGLAGLQAAIQLGRYRRRVLVIDKGKGRSTLCRKYRNLLGWPGGISGQELRRLGRAQAEQHDVHFLEAEVIAAAKRDGRFELALSGGGAVKGETLLIATGIQDRYPPLKGLEERLGASVYICPDCDGYEASGKSVLILGSGEAGSGMALAVRYWTDRITYINHGGETLGTAKLEKLKEAGIGYIEGELAEVLGRGDSETLEGARLTDGRVVPGERAFIAFGGNVVQTDWAATLGIERLENKHILTDPRTKMTHIPGVWAAGDVGVHSEQAAIAIGEGSQAAIWIQKELTKREAHAEVMG